MKYFLVLLSLILVPNVATFRVGIELSKCSTRCHGSARTNLAFQRLQRQQKKNLSTRLNYMDSKDENDSTLPTKETSGKDDTKKVTLIPLAREPLILVSSEPILTLDECATLRNHFQEESTPGGEALLQRIKSQIDELTSDTLSDNVNDDGFCAMPRFVVYPPNESTCPLFPHGLHFDVTPIMASLTCLVYLTSNGNTGATSFPLANPLKKETSVSSDDIQIAQTLLDTGMTHTFDECQPDENSILIAKLERIGKDLYHNDTGTGVRVLPRAGMACVFGNLLDNGMADPQSLHAGEGGHANEKVLLTFFREIPVELFETRKEFQKCAADTRKYLLERYYYGQEEEQ